MWQPDFPFVEAAIARLYGWHRAMCIVSHVYRGTVECPGLVLGLDRGGSCPGMGFRIDPHQWGSVQKQLDDRELITQVYLPRMLPLVLKDGRKVQAYGYVANTDSPQYWRGAVGDAVQMIVQGVGERGTSHEYLCQTLAHLQELGLKGQSLRSLHKKVVAAMAVKGS